MFGWVKPHGRCSIEFEERGPEIYVIVGTWEKSTFRRGCLAVLSGFSTNTTLEATILGKILDAGGADVSVVLLHGVLHVPTEAFVSYLGSGYCPKLAEYATFDLRLLKRCLQRTDASAFGSFDTFSRMDFAVSRMNSAETCNWMAPRPALRNAIITVDLSMPGLVYVVANIIGV